MNKIEQLISTLKLLPHPEGGFFKETYRSNEEITIGESYRGKRNISTCIYFLLTSDAFSAFHRIQQDEIWHYYDGSPLLLHIISPTGEYTGVKIGRNINNGEIPQFVVPGGCWFAANVVNDEDFTLLGCTVSPGFDFRDFELADRLSLIQQFPEHESIVTKLTR
ncbi:MAG: cupin domain-containing protein [Paludibacter sp.]|nr:cupin domain-containing protein [Paludibacter sp.]